MKKDPVTLSDSITALSGIGEKRAAVFRNIGIFSIKNLLDYFPRAYLDRSVISPVGKLEPDTFGVVVVVVNSVENDRGKRLVLRTSDDSGEMDIVFFGGIKFLVGRFSEGDKIHAWGRIGEFRGVFQMVHPEYKIIKDGDLPETGVFPIYSGSADLKDVLADSRVIGAAVKDALARTAHVFHDPLPNYVVNKRAFLPLKEAYSIIHYPSSVQLANNVIESAMNRFRYEEAFLLVYKMRLLRMELDGSGIAFRKRTSLSSKVFQNAGFIPTEGQLSVINEIEADLFSDLRMNRLLQGDVGSGKTFVCAVAASHVLENGYQVLVMAPTEILARQHAYEMERLYNNTGVRIRLVVSEMDTKTREEALEASSNGACGIWVGTHALFSSDISYSKVGLVIVDEQHKFGVKQRLTLRKKGVKCDMLLVSATPIPRTMAMTLYSDLSVSILGGMPPGRQSVKTHIVSEKKRADMYRFINGKLQEGGRTFVVLPMIENSDDAIDLRSVAGTVEVLSNIEYFRGLVGYVHGKMDADEKKKAIELFRSGSRPILVSTTVVEVGVDVPEADIMIIEHPERFGLAQLHQLRGRVGRGKKESFCFLLAGNGGGAQSLERLRKFAATNDGFEIAEIDLLNRGAGELSGLNQSGMPEFKYLDFCRDKAQIEAAREDALAIIENPSLVSANELSEIRNRLKVFDGLRAELLSTA